MDQLKAETFFLALYDQFADAIFRYCYFRVSSRELAEDLMQESFMKAWKYLCDGHEIDNPKAFLYKTAGNLVIDHYRAKRQEVGLQEAEEANLLGHAPSSEADMEQSLAMEKVARAIRLLSPLHQDVVIMRFVEELTVKEVGTTLKKSEGAVKVLQHRAIQKLKELLLS